MFKPSRTMSPMHPVSPAMQPVLDALGELVIRFDPMGSRVTCSPAPTDTDEDWLILYDSRPFAVLKALGFTQEGSPEFYTGRSDGNFQSWRLGDLNVVTTDRPQFYERFMTATHLAKRFNLLDKQDRIALFQVILYDVDVSMLEPRVLPYLPAWPTATTAAIDPQEDALLVG